MIACVTSAGENPSTQRPAADLERALIEQSEALRAVFDLSDWFAGAADLQTVLDATAKRVAEVMNVKACGIRLLNEHTGELTIKASYNLSDTYLNKGPVVVNENPIDAAAMAGETVYVENAWNDPRVRYPQQAKAEGLVSGLCAPLTYRGQTVGVIRVYSDKPHRFSGAERALLRAAGTQAAAGIIESRLIDEHRKSERYLRQVQYAGEIQRRMIPDKSPEHPWATFGCVYAPSLDVGGDFYDFIELPGGELGVAIADVVGKGIPGALMMASVRSALRAHTAHDHCMEDLMARVNRHMCHDTLVGEFATVFYGVLSNDTRQLSYVNAGHDPPLLLRNKEFRKLDVGGMIIGVVPDCRFDSETIDLEPGDLIVLYTDGVIDAMNFDGEHFGRERLRESILKYSSTDAAIVAQQIMWDTRRFTGLAPQTDDITIVAVKVTERPSEREVVDEACPSEKQT